MRARQQWLHVVRARPEGVEVALDPLGRTPQALFQSHLGLPARPLPRPAVVAQQALDLAPRRPQTGLFGQDLHLATGDLGEKLDELADGDLSP